MIATDIFLFGTLLDEDVCEIVFTGAPRLVAARLDNCQRCRLPDESYPVRDHRPGRSRARAARVFRERRVFAAALPGSHDRRASITTPRPEPSPAPPSCSLASWLSVHKPRYLEMVRAYMELYGEASRDEAKALWERLRDRAGAS